MRICSFQLYGRRNGRLSAQPSSKTLVYGYFEDGFQAARTAKQKQDAGFASAIDLIPDENGNKNLQA